MQGMKEKIMADHNLSTWARISGFIYFIVIATGIFSLMYVPSEITVKGDAAATIANIRSHETMYRSGIAALLINQIAFFLLPLALYVLLAPTNRLVAQIMVLAALIGIPLGLASAAERIFLIELLTSKISVSPQAVLDLVAVSRARANEALMIATTFWGLWLLPFGYLVFRSGCLPRVLGIFLMAGCVGYLVNLFGLIMVPNFSELTIASIVRVPATIGEIGIGLWLLLIGIRTPKIAPG
jgi:hypothetical protein